MQSNILEDHSLKEFKFPSNIDESTHVFCSHYFSKKKKVKNVIHIIFQHGMIEHQKRHISLFNALRKEFGAGVIISAMDLVGHGLSGGNRAYVDEFNTYVRDMYDFVKICHDDIYNDFNVEKTFLISHSLGGLISLKLISDDERELPISIDSLILSNPCISPKLTLPKTVTSSLELLPVTAGQVRLPLIYDAYDITHDNDSAIEFMHDHLISKAITINLGLETLKAVKPLNSLSYFIKHPCLFLLSGEDKVVDNKKTELFITGMDKKKVDVKYYPNMRHDLFNETCRDDVFKNVISFIKKRRKK